MSLFDSASLVVTPNGQKAGKLYSIKPTDGSGDLSVVRATSATRVDANGLVEIPRTNLILQSQTFDNASWSKQFSSITANATNAPDSTLTADKLVDNATLNQHRIDQTPTAAIGTYTFSVYLKKAEIDTCWIRIGTLGADFNLTNGTTYGQSPGVTSSIQNYGNGWYRCSITRTTTGANEICRINLKDSNNSTYLGNGTDGLFIWGAQLEQGVSATEYIPTVASIRTKFAGITQDGGSASNIPRLDYTNSTCPSILVEPQRTNLVLRSEEFTNVNWEKGTPITLVSNTTETTSPQGINNATKATANGTGLIHIRQAVFGGTTSPTTNSIFVKKANNRYVGFRNGGAGFGLHDVFDFNTETWTNNSGSTLSFDRLTNGWYRLKSSRTNTLPNSYISVTIPNNTSGNETATVSNLTLYLWGGQSELNVLYATSYIPTVASTVTRNADVISKTGISSLIGQTEGTMFVDAYVSIKNEDLNPVVGLITINNNVNNIDNCIIVGIDRPTSGVNNKVYTIVQLGGATVAEIFTSTITSGRYKIAFAYKQNDFALYVNGVLIGTDTSGNVPTCSQALIGSRYNGDTYFLGDEVNAAVLWKTRLTNAELATLTTI
jgi:hypothetical protein